MANRTLSAYVEESAVHRIGELAKVEARSPAQIAGAGIKFYVGLPATTHAAIRYIDACATPGEVESARREISRVLARTQMVVAQRIAAAEIQTNLANDATEEEILAEAQAIMDNES